MICIDIDQRNKMFSTLSRSFLKQSSSTFPVAGRQFRFFDQTISRFKGTSMHGIEPILKGDVLVSDISSYQANKMITSCLNSNSQTGFVLYEKLKGEHEIDSKTYRSLLIQAASFPGKTNEILKEINIKKVDINEKILSGLLVNMLSQKDTLKCIKIAKKIIEREGSLHSTDLTNVVEFLIKQKDYAKEALEIYQLSNESNGTIISYNKVILTAAKIKDFELVIYFYSEAKKNNCSVSESVTELILNEFLADNQFIQVYQLFEDGIISKTCKIYEILFSAIYKDNQLTNEEKIQFTKKHFDNFLKNKIPLSSNSTLLERILDIYMKQDTPELVKSFMKNLETYHFNVLPSMIYRISDKFGHIDDFCPLIISILDRVKNKGNPSVRSLVYQKIMNIYIEKSNIPKALCYFREMRFFNLSPTSLIYNQLITACCNHYLISDIIELKQCCEKDNLKLSRSIYSLIVSTFLEIHEEENIPTIMNDLENLNYRIDTTANINQILNNCIKEILPNENLAELPQRTSKTTEYIFTLLQDLIIQLYFSNFVNAKLTLDELYKISPNIPIFIHSTLIRFLGKNKSLNDCLSYIKKYQLKNSIHIEIIDSILNVNLFNKKFDQVISTFNSLSSLQITPTINTYNYMILALFETKNFDRIKQIQDDFFKLNHFSPLNHSIFKNFVKIYCSIDDLQSAKEIINFALSKNLFPELAFEILISKYSSNKQYNEAAELLRSAPEITLRLIRPLLYDIHENSQLRSKFLYILKSKKVPPSDIALCFPTSLHASFFLKDY